MNADGWPAFEEVDDPVASIIVPVHGQWQLTVHCLHTVATAPQRHRFEVIVVDDCSPDATAEALTLIPGLRIVRTPTNVGFLRACNLGARAARAAVIVFLNNDTAVHDDWLDALLDVLDEQPEVGLVGSMLIGTDGVVQESGGIIWSDGTGYNFGRGLRPDRCEVGVVRDVDYCSGAAIAVRRAIFEELGGFDDRYAPAYYEDTDLAFAVRAAGHRVVVQPECRITHAEGASHGSEGSGGIKRFQEVNRVAFVRKWREALAERGSYDGPGSLWAARNRHGKAMVLIVDALVPMPDRDSGSRRMAAIIDELLAMGLNVHFAPASNFPTQPYTRAFERKGVTVLAAADDQERFLREAGSRLSMVMLTRAAVAWTYLDAIYAHAPDSLIVFDTVDLHSLRAHRQAHLGGDPSSIRRAELVWAREAAAMLAADVTLVVSEFERQLLAELMPNEDVRVLSNVHVPRVGAPSGAGRRRHVLFVGGYQHPPNVEAALWAAHEIMPLVWERVPGAVLRLAGADLPPVVAALAGPRIEVLGWVPDLSPVYAEARVVIAPLRHGAGVKGKVAEAIEHGVPLVGTGLAVEGMHLDPDEDVVVADDAPGIAEGVVRLLVDDARWASMAGRAQRQLVEHFSPQSARAVLECLLDPADPPRRLSRLVGR